MKDDTTNAPTKLHQCDWKFLMEGGNRPILLKVTDRVLYSIAQYIKRLEILDVWKFIRVDAALPWMATRAQN